ncbi:hypothetical protein B0F90DRAFT_1757754 [Multifurca ochricompacta]|uniref:Uncharacterized protein n=1 Tax=Multifurca ochricompacta TaxID=376703 RepID=A0AAD4QKI7_9AGAM|nr:hypothetical protein B0F90DRAFT_1757754 [Multifurca ochricompacta]
MGAVNSLISLTLTLPASSLPFLDINTSPRRLLWVVDGPVLYCLSLILGLPYVSGCLRPSHWCTSLISPCFLRNSISLSFSS